MTARSGRLYCDNIGTQHFAKWPLVGQNAICAVVLTGNVPQTEFQGSLRLLSREPQLTPFLLELCTLHDAPREIFILIAHCDLVTAKRAGAGEGHPPKPALTVGPNERDQARHNPPSTYAPRNPA